MNETRMVYSAIDVANQFLKLAKEKEDELTNMQLNKLVYFAHGWMLGLCGEPLIDENVEAWNYGPVIRPIYRKYQRYGKNPIAEFEEIQQDLHKQASSIIKETYEIYGAMSGLELADLTHEYESPWFITVMSSESIITNDIIESYFKELSGE